MVTPRAAANFYFWVARRAARLPVRPQWDKPLMPKGLPATEGAIQKLNTTDKMFHFAYSA